MGRGSRQKVTGVIVNECFNAPRELRRELLQQAYFIDKYGLRAHIEYKGIRNPGYINKLLGQAYFVKFINRNTPKIDWIISVFKRYCS